MVHKIIAFARELKDKHGACGLKLGTEAEANSFEEIRLFTDMLNDILPIIVKIGGCDARNDIKTLFRIGIKGLIAPMIESEYGLKNFRTALRQEIGANFRDLFGFLAINIESRTGYQNRFEILDSPDCSFLDQVTIGRTDLSSSYSTSVDDPELESKVIELTRMAQKRGLLVSIGGQITPSSSVQVRDHIMPDKVNIRTVVIDMKHCPDISEAIRKSLEFEKMLLKCLIDRPESDPSKLKNRIEVIEKRLQN